MSLSPACDSERTVFVDPMTTAAWAGRTKGAISTSCAGTLAARRQGSLRQLAASMSKGGRVLKELHCGLLVGLSALGADIM